MAENNAVVGIYNSHTEAEASIKELQRSGFDMKKLSIVGKDYHTEEHVVADPTRRQCLCVSGRLSLVGTIKPACRGADQNRLDPGL